MPVDHYTPRIGIMRDVRFGLQDRRVALTFRLDTGTGWMTHLELGRDEYERLFWDTGIDDVKRLNGFPCYYITTNGIMRFKGPVLDSPKSRPWDWEENRDEEHEEALWMLRLHWLRQGQPPTGTGDDYIEEAWAELGRRMGIEEKEK